MLPTTESERLAFCGMDGTSDDRLLSSKTPVEILDVARQAQAQPLVRLERLAAGLSDLLRTPEKGESGQKVTTDMDAGG